MQNTKVTVFMPVYNGEKYLKEAIESILSQSYKDFEFLIINDGSTDRSAEIIESYEDKRIKFINNRENSGVEATRNMGIEYASGEYIATLDCDDISHSQRLEKQVCFMDKNPEIGVCGSWIEIFSETDSKIFSPPIEKNEIKCKLFFFNTFANSSTMIRKSLFKRHNLSYSQAPMYAVEDYDIWRKANHCFSMANLPEILVRYRQVSSGISKKNFSKRIEIMKQLDKRDLEYLGICADDETLDLHQELCPLRYPAMPVNKDFVMKSNEWLKKILNANKKAKLYPEPIFSNIIGERWFAVCNTNASFGLWTLKAFYGSELSKHAKISTQNKLKFVFKCLRFGK